MQQLAIRRASSADAQALTELSIDTFVETFGPQYDPRDLHDYLRATYSAEQYRAALEEQGCAAWLLHDINDVVLGYAYCGPCGLPHADVRAGDLELKRLYIRKQAQNSGWGARLYAYAHAWMLVSHPHALWLGVYSENYGAQKFYARQGFEKVGEYFFSVGAARDLEYILRKPAKAAESDPVPPTR